MSNPMADFVNARLDEDEFAERAVLAARVMDGGNPDLIIAADEDDGIRPICDYDPARMLREVEAKRKILRRYTAWQQAERGSEASGPPSAAIVAVAHVLRDVVADLAAADSDHPDYRQDWAGQ